MSTLLRRDPRTMVPDLIEWFEEPFMTLRPYLAQPIRVEDYLTGDHYMVRAEVAGIDPEKDGEVTVGSGYLNIHAERHDQTEGKHRSEFRYGSLPPAPPAPAQGEGTVGSGYLNIHAEQYDQTEGKHRSEFRYGSFTRSLPLPAHVNEDDVTASYADGILTISVGLHPEKKEALKKIEIKGAK